VGKLTALYPFCGQSEAALPLGTVAQVDGFALLHGDSQHPGSTISNINPRLFLELCRQIAVHGPSGEQEPEEGIGLVRLDLGSEHAGGSTGGAIADVLLFQHQHAQTGHGALIGDRTADDTGANHENFR